MQAGCIISAELVFRVISAFCATVVSLNAEITQKTPSSADHGSPVTGSSSQTSEKQRSQCSLLAAESRAADRNDGRDDG